MRVFIIPSWYPSYSQPLAGIFFQEQAEAIADLIPNIQVIVSTWGHDAGHLSFRKPLDTLKAIYWRFSQPRNSLIRYRSNIQEIFTPALSWPLSYVINANWKNLRLAEKKIGKIDLIHAHVSYIGGYIASILSHEFSIPYIITEHMSPFPFSNFIQNDKINKIINDVFLKAASTIAVSPSLSKQITSFGFKQPYIIPNLVDERRFRLNQPETEKFVFFTLCLISEQKGIDHLLESIALWNPSPNQIEFRIGGDGPMRSFYEQKAIELGLSDRVRWLGAVSRAVAPQLFRECHAYVMPSRHETFGVVYAEAIASGKPVIATRCGGPEFIVNDFNGILVDVGDRMGLAEAMREMADNWHSYDPKLIRQDFLARFSRQAVVSQLEKIYQAAAKTN